MFLNLGAGASSIWLFGPDKIWKQLWKPDGVAAGWHPTPRVQLQLARGDYRLLTESDTGFFVSLTSDDAM